MSTDETPTPPTEQQRAEHQAAMDRAVQGIYTAACVVGQVGQLPPHLLGRLMVCATVHSLERLITLYRQRDESQGAAFGAEERQRMLARILGDCDDAKAAMTEALQSIEELRAIILTPESKLVS
jgi:hypothetical protein